MAKGSVSMPERLRMPEEDTYVVYTGFEDGAATFSLYDDGGVVTKLTISPEYVPSGTDIGDHFWINHADGDGNVKLQFDPEFTAQKQEKARAAVEMYRDLQESDRSDLNETDDG